MIRQLVARRRGNSMIEFAIMLSLLLLLTMGVVDASLAVWEYNTISYLAREGARYGIVPSRTPTQIKTYVLSRAILPGLTAGNIAVTDRGTCGDLTFTDPVVVTVTYQYQPASPVIAIATGGAINLQALASMYVEQGAAGVDCACGGSCA